MEPIELSAGGGGSKQPRQLREPRARKGLNKQKNTLTQMDFLGMRGYRDERGDEGLGLITPDGDFEGTGVEARKENVDPDTGKKAGRAQRKSVLSAERISAKTKGKRRKSMIGETAHDQDWLDGTPRSTDRGGLRRTALSEQKPGRSFANSGIVSISRTTRVPTKADGEQPPAKCNRLFAHDEKQNLSAGDGLPRLTIPETPRKQRYVIPSSQSPESISFSSRKRPRLLREIPEASPLRERSMNVTPIAFSGMRHAPTFSSARACPSPKKKMCVFKYGPGRFRKPDLPGAELHDVDVRGSTTPQPLQPLQGEKENIARSSTNDHGGGGSASEIPRKATEPGIPETSQIVQPEFIPSSQTDVEEEEEIPETSQGIRRFTSTSSLNRSEESLQMLSDKNHTPVTAKKTSSRETVDQVEPSVLDADIQVHDFGSSREQGGNNMDPSASAPRQTANDVPTPARFPGQLPQKESTTSTIQDSEYEDDITNTPLRTASPVVDDTQSTSDLMRRAPTTSVIAADLQSPSANAPSSPTFPPLPAYASYLPATITRIPTKLPPSSSSSSSPSLPRPPRSTTQQSIHPASMTRPSQVSTQAPTQQSWLPMSSMPVVNTLSSSSPDHHDDHLSHVTIKDSSSTSTPLRDIPSQSQAEESQFALVDLGLENEFHPGLDDHDDDLDPKSSQPTILRQPLSHADEGSGENNHSHPNQRPNHHQGTQPPTPQGHRHPLARLRLSESMLESLPEPPGWVPTSSQRSGTAGGAWDWDDMML